MKLVDLKELKGRMLDTEEARDGYAEADREIAIVALLNELRAHAGLTKTELARRLNITPSALTQLEKKPGGVKLSTLDRYAAACGATINISASYKK